LLVFKITKICDGCGLCVSSCPLDVIEEEDGTFRVGFGCNQCGVCAGICPTGAITKE